ncbi:uncharacterized protein SCDLUD_002892 [Saccharomycodes ludwigii]|uniref:uncharacterized protein n=1 Tax=Saccharomycodes ludwigii TaxID=36035 RepID=UPI001E8572E1|nr:hypothetical protein SCDLUD_002892 [Saccharomycodes ludwigii]KAH3901400.1 hypothetical protein SCDLUD_002892 [Saccharomycodes ludwigii]
MSETTNKVPNVSETEPLISPQKNTPDYDAKHSLPSSTSSPSHHQNGDKAPSAKVANSVPSHDNIAADSIENHVTNGKKTIPGSYASPTVNHRQYDSVETNDTTFPHGIHNGEDVENDEDNNSHFCKTLNYTKFNHNSKYLLNLLLFINTIWLFFIFVSDYFFDINLLFRYSNRITGFTDLNLIFISIISNFLSLWFNHLEYYSPIDQYLNFINSGIILLNFFLFLIIGYNRERLGLIGKATFIWAFISFFLSGIIDYKMEFYIKPLLSYNEELSTGGTFTNTSTGLPNTTNKVPGMRHTLSEWISIGFRNTIKFIILLYLTLFTLNSFLYTIDIQRTVNKQHKGSIDTSTASRVFQDGFYWTDTDNSTFKLHVSCYGDLAAQDDNSAEPLVIFEHGSQDTSYISGAWIKELYNFSKLGKYCVYDRPGFGTSDSCTAPTSISMVADGIKKIILQDFQYNNGEIVVVGYDIGGLYAQVLCSKFGSSKCTKLMLVDSWHEDILTIQTWLPHNSENSGLDKYTRCIIGKWNVLKLWLYGCFESSLGFSLLRSLVFHRRGSIDRISGDYMVYQGKYLRSRFLESLTSGILSYKEVVQNKENLKNIEVSVVSSKEMISKNVQWGDWQRDLTQISKQTKEWEIIEAGHQVFNGGKKKLQDVLIRLIEE